MAVTNVLSLVINLKTAKAISLNRSDRGPMGEALEKMHR
jgi:hypothetical protein